MHSPGGFMVQDMMMEQKYTVATSENWGKENTEIEEANEEQWNRLESYFQRRLKGEPIQYIIKEWDFYGRTYHMQPPVLICRPETEQMVDIIINSIKSQQQQQQQQQQEKEQNNNNNNNNKEKEKTKEKEKVNINKSFYFLEIGVGSGVIISTILNEIPNAFGIGIDCNPQCIELSLKNLHRHSISKERFQLFHFDIFQWNYGNFNNFYNFKNKLDMIVSNPPYIFTKEMKELDKSILEWEDWKALNGGENGLDVIDCILQNSHWLLKKNQQSCIWLETHHDHPKMIQNLEQHYQYLSKKHLKLDGIYPDWNRVNRFLKFSLNLKR